MQHDMLLISLWTRDVYLSISQPASTVSSNDGAKKQMGFKILRGRLYNEYRLRILTATYEAVTTRVFGRSFALTTCRVYRELLAASLATWQPIFHSLPQSADGSTSSVAEGTSQSLPCVALAFPLPPYHSVLLCHLHLLILF